MKRTKRKVIAGVNRESADEAFALYANAHNQMAKIEAKMNEELNTIRDKYLDEIKQLEGQKEQQIAVLQVFATEQKDNWGKRKSLEMLYGKVGFRTGMHKLKCSKGFNWKKVTELLKQYYPVYVRTVEEPNKEKLIADRDSKGFVDVCNKVHLKVVQEETFFIEPKIEQLQSV